MGWVPARPGAKEAGNILRPVVPWAVVRSSPSPILATFLDTLQPPLRVWKGLLTWGQQHAGAALDTDTVCSFATEPAKRLGQRDGEVGRLPMEGSLLCVYTPVIPDQAVDDGWTA